MKVSFPTTAKEVASWVNAQLKGNADHIVSNLSSLEHAEPGELVYFSQRKFKSVLAKKENLVVMTREEEIDPALTSHTYLIVPDPELAFYSITKELQPRLPNFGISPLAQIHPTAKIDPGAHIGPFSFIGENCVIGKGTVVFPYAYLAADVTIEEDSEIHAHAVLQERTVVGKRVKVLSGAVIGSPGFGLKPTTQGLLEIPQIGRVVLEDDVRVGAKCTIDRGAIEETRIGSGTKIDDQVHIAHNCQIGKNSILCAQVGLSGSVTLGNNVILAGQVGVGDHVKIGEGAVLMAQSGTSTNLEGNESYFMSPALPIKEALRIIRSLRKLPRLAELARDSKESLAEGEERLPS